MKALIIDDERLARAALRQLLGARADVEIVGEASNADQAREKIAALQPQVIFLDIQMPGDNGMELLASLEPPVPEVIFTTAHDDYAFKAFELNALDYLLKPIEPARLAQALVRLQKRGSGDERQDRNPMRPERLKPGDRVFLRDGDRCWFVEVRHIRLLVSDGSYTRVVFDEAGPQLFRSLNALEARLDPARFFRANRSQIVNIDWIESVEPWFSGGLVLRLKGGEKVEVSRRRALEFRERTSL